MKILFFNQNNSVISGTETFLIELIRNWSEEDYKIVMCNNSFEGKYIYEDLSREVPKPEFIPLGIPTLTDIYNKYKFLRILHPIIKPFALLVYILKLIPVLKKIRPDCLISSNGGYPAGEINLAINVAGRISGVRKNILIIHNLPKRESKFPLPEYFLDGIISWACDKIITVSKACAEDLIRRRNFKKEVEYIYNGINNKKIDTVSKEEKYNKLGISESDDIIGYIGVLEERKGIHYLIDAMPEIINKRPKVKLIIIGEGEEDYAHSLREKVKQLGIKNHVVFTGYISNAAQFMECFNVFVLPSIEFESFGLVILEAMLYKVPVVATDIGGIPEVVKSGETGFIVEAKNPEALADKILFLLSNRELAQVMGENGYNLLLSKFTSEKMAERYMRLVKNQD